MREGELSSIPEDKKLSETSESEKTDAEREIIEKGFAKVLRETPTGGFHKKLRRIGGALVLAGLIFHPKDKALAPQPSAELEAVQKIGIAGIRKMEKYNPEMYQRVLTYLQKRGGIPLSHDLPETIYRPYDYSEIVRGEAFESDTPFYNRPEVILGEEFIKNNPEQAKEYLKRISTAMEATVVLASEGLFGSGSVGSGVILENKKGKRFIVTNAHVVDENSSITLLHK